MLKASDKVWVCEKGHVDDHHIEDAGMCPACGGSGVGDHGPDPDPVCVTCDGGGRTNNKPCSRRGGTCEQFSLDGLAREYRERLRVNVGLIAENTQLKRKVAGLEAPDAKG
jgi:hypothetical protein